jgi:hypothetical protein
MTCQVGTDGPCASSSATVYSYDPKGEPVAKTTGTSVLVEEYVYDFSGNQFSAHNSTNALHGKRNRRGVSEIKDCPPRSIGPPLAVPPTPPHSVYRQVGKER